MVYIKYLYDLNHLISVSKRLLKQGGNIVVWIHHPRTDWLIRGRTGDPEARHFVASASPDAWKSIGTVRTGVVSK